MRKRQWEYLSTVFREVGNVFLAVLVIGQFVLEQGIEWPRFLWGIAISIALYGFGFAATFLPDEEQ
jgi:hypothetical protein